MEQLDLNSNSNNSHVPTLRDIVAIAFRHRRLMLLSFLGICLGVSVVTMRQPNRYEAEIKILVKRDRVDSVVTPEAISVPQLNSEVTEAELNSEVILLKNKPLLEKVVLACDLQHQNRSDGPKAFASISDQMRRRDPKERERMASAVRALDKALRVDVVKRTNVIAVNYASGNPELSARVLNTLATLYLENHVLVHRPPGAFDFFRRESQKYREVLTRAQAHLMDFNQGAGVVSAPLEKTVALQKLAEFDGSLRQTEGAIGEVQQRIVILEGQAASTPTRMLTQVRKTDDGVLLAQIKSTLLALEQKRSELLTKYEPTYKPVEEVNAAIAEVQAALAAGENSKLHEETTDRDPTYELVRQELTKAKAELAGLQARAKVTAQNVQSYREMARSLGQKEIVQDDLIRMVKTSEENYLLYLRKEEQARISDALDRGRILNVVIAEAAAPPSVPSNNRLAQMLLGLLMAAFVSGVLVFGSEFLDTTFRTPDELGTFLEIPVLAAIPRNGKRTATAHVS